jgi:hypothetical protein
MRGLFVCLLLASATACGGLSASDVCTQSVVGNDCPPETFAIVSDTQGCLTQAEGRCGQEYLEVEACERNTPRCQDVNGTVAPSTVERCSAVFEVYTECVTGE